MASTCSFRITRTTEDLAQTVISLSQRLVQLEQRQEALELLLSEAQKEDSPEEIKILDDVDLILKECKELLEASSKSNNLETINSSEPFVA